MGKPQVKLFLAFSIVFEYSLLMMEKVTDYIRQYHMIKAGDKIIAGISGGADSVCLFFVLLTLRHSLGIDLITVHVNHGIRGPAAQRDEHFVEDLCKKHGVKYIVYRKNVESISRKRKQSVEEAGRFVRRDAFFETLEKYGGTKIAMAHHQNDNAETLLMNLARGTGLQGLGGIRPVAGNIIRPLLCLNRKEIEEYVNQQGCGFCLDETNEEEKYTRNRIRHQIIPVLEQSVNTAAVRHMNETMIQMRKLQAYMDEQVAYIYADCVDKRTAEYIRINESGFKAHHEVPAEMFLRHCLEEMAGSGRDISARHVKAVQELFGRQAGRKLDLPYEIEAVRDYGAVILQKKEAASTFEQQTIPIRVPGETQIPGSHLTICCSVFQKPVDFSVNQAPRKAYTKWFDYDIIRGNLVVRGKQKKDKIVIDDEGHRQKLKSYFINEKIPSKERQKILIFADDEQVLWIFGYRMSNSCRVTGKTKRVLEIKVTEEKNYVRDN